MSDGWTVDRVLGTLADMGSAESRAGMARFGVETDTAFGVSVSALRGLARRMDRNTDLARELWASGRHEARILATLVAVPGDVSEADIDAWVQDLGSWDLCDLFCNNLVRRLPFAWDKALAWSAEEPLYVKRAGFTLMACLAVHDKRRENAAFLDLLRVIEREAADDRNHVRKSVNWALRQIGKRSVELNAAAVELASRLKSGETRAARWVGADAHRELTGDKVRARLRANGTA